MSDVQCGCGRGVDGMPSAFGCSPGCMQPVPSDAAASPADRALLQAQAARAEDVGFGIVVGEAS